MNANVDTGEIAHFEGLAARWWDPRGEMGALHAINPVRTRYIERTAGGLKGKTAVDVGCGGGILTEALARAGADSLGIDLAAASIKVAQEHAAEHGLLNAQYRLVSAEDLAAERPEGFDVVCCLEMLEHVPAPACASPAAPWCSPPSTAIPRPTR